MDRTGPDPAADPYVTIARFPHPADLVFVEAELRERRIPYEVLDANLVQTAPFYSAAIGGVRLQVPSSRTTEAIEVLRDLGIEEEREQAVPKWITWFDEQGRRLPFLRQATSTNRLLIMLAGVVLVLVIVALILAPRRIDPLAELTGQQWWIESIEHDGGYWEPSLPKTDLVYVQMNGVLGQISFRSGGRVQFPCTTSSDLTAHWYVSDGRLVIHDADTLQHIYEGVYEVSFSRNEFVMRSSRTLIHSRAYLIYLEPPQF